MADTYQVLNLAAIIRKVDGNHSKGAAALAESILDHPRFRAVLAGGPAVPQGREPAAVTGQPSDEELLDLLPQGNESGFWLPKGLPSDWVYGEFIAPPKAIIAFARDVLELWGNPTPQPPADGEVAELTGQLIEAANGAAAMGWDQHARSILRAAELLQRQVLVPVSVSERLPGAEETTEDGEVWIGDPGHDYPLADTGDYDWEPHRWVLRQIGKFDAKNNLHWLPAHALPLPEVGE